MLFHAPSFSIGLILGAAIVLTTGYLPELLAPPAQAPRVGAAPGPQSAPQPLTFTFDTVLRTPPAAVAVESAPAGQPGGPLTGNTTPTAPGNPVVGEPESATPGVMMGSAPGIAGDAPTGVPAGPAGAAPGAMPPASTVAVVESEAVASRPPARIPEPAGAAATQTPYMLQAASFRSRADADRLRAELLLLDLPASTGEVNVGNTVWYRVTVGPFANQQSADAAKERLRARNLTAIPFKG